ncbi:MAG: DUF6582 domain-containing protein, partial [Rhodomicrobium sp.]
ARQPQRRISKDAFCLGRTEDMPSTLTSYVFPNKFGIWGLLVSSARTVISLHPAKDDRLVRRQRIIHIWKGSVAGLARAKQRKEPLTDAQHVRNAVARFDQVIAVSDSDRALAFANIEKAAKHYNVDLSETSWHDLGVHPQRNRKEAAAKGAATRKRKREEQG